MQYLTLNSLFYVENLAMKPVHFSDKIKKSVHTLTKIKSSFSAYLCAVFVNMNRSLSSKLLFMHEKFNTCMSLCRILT